MTELRMQLLPKNICELISEKENFSKIIDSKYEEEKTAIKKIFEDFLKELIVASENAQETICQSVEDEKL